MRHFVNLQIQPVCASRARLDGGGRPWHEHVTTHMRQMGHDVKAEMCPQQALELLRSAKSQRRSGIAQVLLVSAAGIERIELSLLAEVLAEDRLSAMLVLVLSDGPASVDQAVTAFDVGAIDALPGKCSRARLRMMADRVRARWYERASSCGNVLSSRGLAKFGGITVDMDSVTCVAMSGETACISTGQNEVRVRASDLVIGDGFVRVGKALFVAAHAVVQAKTATAVNGNRRQMVDSIVLSSGQAVDVDCEYQHAAFTALHPGNEAQASAGAVERHGPDRRWAGTASPWWARP